MNAYFENWLANNEGKLWEPFGDTQVLTWCEKCNWRNTATTAFEAIFLVASHEQTVHETGLIFDRINAAQWRGRLAEQAASNA